MVKKIRKPAVAGSFYPRSESDLREIIHDSFLDKKFGPGEEMKSLNQQNRSIIGGISPHAGYIYSGCASAYTFLNLFKEKIPDTVIILGTDHVGYGGIALMEEGAWETPLGNLSIDDELSKEILKNSEIIKGDDSAFIGIPFGREHNIEVQLPFIKYCAKEKDIKIVPIKISTKNFEIINQLSSDIANIINSNDKDIVIVASSDMTHKQPKNIMNPKKNLENMREMDQAVMDAFVEFEPKKTFKAALKTSVCGPQTITSLMLICKKMNANKCKFLKYYNSYEKQGGSGPCEYSVGYFSGIIKK
ncbi:MAG: AmmeMemoRadiSam system protein B [Promethearchaeota archaeon]